MGIRHIQQRCFTNQSECEKNWESCKVPGKSPLKLLLRTCPVFRIVTTELFFIVLDITFVSRQNSTYKSSKPYEFYSLQSLHFLAQLNSAFLAREPWNQPAPQLVALWLHGGPAAAQGQRCSWQELMEEGPTCSRWIWHCCRGCSILKQPKVKVTLGKYVTEKRVLQVAKRKRYAHV